MDLISRDLAHIWHPCSQMKDYATFKPLHVVSAQGCYLQLATGQIVIDAISSWWCKNLGHQRPELQQALLAQSQRFEHVILANTTNDTIVELAERLTALNPSLNKVLFASDGSCAIEMAVKLSLHSRIIQGDKQRTHFMALANDYHGETGIALALSDLGIYRDPYRALLPEVSFLQHIPYVQTSADPQWHDCSAIWPTLEEQLNQHATTLSAIVVEPILQGAGGMRIYSQDLLRRLRAWTTAHNVHLIADEILTGLGRTGTALACEHAGITPDFMCLGKGLTAGYLPMSACLTTDAIYALFYGDYQQGNSFLHSHTHAGNALAAAVANATLDILAKENIYDRVQTLQPQLLHAMQSVAARTGRLVNVRGIGGMVAADLITDDPQQRLGFAVYQRATELGALLRPLGNTLYWLPPLTIEADTLAQLRDITTQAITDTVSADVYTPRTSRCKL